MIQLLYFRYVEEVTDWRVQALQELEYTIVCKASRYRIHHHAPEDIAQELRILLWEKLPSYDPAKGGLKTWANRIMENRIKNIWKREHRTQKRRDWMAQSLEFLEISEYPDFLEP